MPRVVDPWIGTLFGNYRAVRKLGEGGMGVVYEAEHQKIGHRAAVKILKRELALDEEYAQRFLNEARAVNIIRHPGLVEIFDYGKLPDGTLFYVMEFLQGASLASRMEDKPGGWPAETVVELGLQVAKAIGEAHAKGVIHREAYEKTMTCFRVSAKDAHRRRTSHGYSEAEDGSYSPLQLV